MTCVTCNGEGFVRTNGWPFGPDCPDCFFPDGLRNHEGEIQFQCNSCENWTEWHGDPADFKLGEHENVCGGSPWCLP